MRFALFSPKMVSINWNIQQVEVRIYGVIIVHVWMI